MTRIKEKKSVHQIIVLQFYIETNNSFFLVFNSLLASSSDLEYTESTRGQVGGKIISGHTPNLVSYVQSTTLSVYEMPR